MNEFWNLLTHMNADKVKLLAGSNTGFALALCFASGVLTSLTPCVYPMIPITINIFGRAAQRTASPESARAFNPHTFFFAVIYVAGMCVTYSILGLIAGMTGSLFGKALQSAWVLGFLTILFFSLALGQLGVFKLALPASWQTKIASLGNSDNLGGIFLMGIFSGLIVSPCVGPVIAGILAFVFDTSNALLGLLYFLSFGLGLGVLFLLIGGFSGILAKLPRSGQWMLRVNRLLAALMIVASGYYAVLLSKQLGWGRGTTGSTAAIAWYSNEDEALRVAKEKGLPVFIDFSAEWCAACHEIERDVFTQSRFQEKLKGFIALRIDVTADSPENEAKLRRYGVLSLPTIAFVGRDGKVLREPRINGNVPVDDFLAAMDKL